MLERPKSEWRGVVVKNTPILAVAIKNLTNQILHDKIEEVFANPNLIILNISAKRPSKEYYGVELGFLGKTFPVFPFKIHGKTYPKLPEVNIEVKSKNKA